MSLRHKIRNYYIFSDMSFVVVCTSCIVRKCQDRNEHVNTIKFHIHISPEFDLDLEPSDTSIAQASLEIDDLELDDVFVVSWWLRTQVQDETRLLTISGDTSDDWLMVTVSDSSHIAVNR